MSYWLADNRDQAEQHTLHRLIGHLTVMKEFDSPVTAQGLLEFLEKAVNEEEARLNEYFPDKARP